MQRLSSSSALKQPRYQACTACVDACPPASRMRLSAKHAKAHARVRCARSQGEVQACNEVMQACVTWWHYDAGTTTGCAALSSAALGRVTAEQPFVHVQGFQAQQPRAQHNILVCNPAGSLACMPTALARLSHAGHTMPCVSAAPLACCSIWQHHRARRCSPCLAAVCTCSCLSWISPLSIETADQ